MPEDSSLSSLQLRTRISETLDDFHSLRWRARCCALVVLVGLAFYGLTGGPEGKEAGAPEASSGIPSYVTSTTATTVSTKKAIVYVVGAVTEPGLYSLSTDARISDVIDAAGGLAANADAARLNLAAKITDGQRIYVVAQGEAGPAAASRRRVHSGEKASGTPESAGPININDANESQLDALPGVGPATATAIVSYRTEHGAFASVDDLSKVKGIGPSKLEQIRPQATV